MDDPAFTRWLADKSWAHAVRYCKVVAWLVPLAAAALVLPMVLRGTFSDTVGSYWLVAWQLSVEITCVAVILVDRRLPKERSRELPLYLLCAMFMLLTTWAGVRGVLIGGGGLMLYAAGSTFIAAVTCTPQPMRRTLYVLSILALAAAYWYRQPDVEGLLTGLVIPFCVVVLCVELDRHTYSRNRELYLQQQVAQAERARADKVLYNVLPASIADELKRNERVDAVKFENMGVLFADIVGFTSYSRALPPDALVLMLNEIFSTFDDVVERHGLEKIKTIGDGYMVTSPGRLVVLCQLALDMRSAMQRYNAANGTALAMRIGVHAGPAVAGVIGVKRFLYDVWGDTVNVASRMEQSGEAGAIHVTEAVYRQARDAFAFEARGLVDIKGRGPMPTYWLVGLPDVKSAADATAPAPVPNLQPS